MEPFVFEGVDPEQVPVKIGNDWYLLQEAMGGAVINWRNGLMSCASMGPDGNPVRVDTIATVEPKLISDCMFYATVKKGVESVKYAGDLEKGGPVPMSVVLSWKHEIYDPLYEWIMKTSNLQDLFKEATDKVKSGIQEQAKLGNVQSG